MTVGTNNTGALTELAKELRELADAIDTTVATHLGRPNLARPR